MSTKTKQVCYYTALFYIAVVVAVVAVFFVTTPVHAAGTAVASVNGEPAPWWMRVEEFQELITRWIAVLTTAVIALSGLAAVVIAKYLDLRDRLNRINDRAETAHTQSVAALASQTTTNAETAKQLADIGKK